MSAETPSPPASASAVELLGRIQELRAEIAEGTNRRARLAGENAVLLDLLAQAKAEIDRQVALLAEPRVPDPV